MRKTLIALSVAGVMAGCSSSQEAVPEDPALESTDEKVSYGMGLVMGQRMSNDLPNLKMEQFLQGIQHGHDGDEEQTRMSREEIQEALMAYQTSSRSRSRPRRKNWRRKIRKPGNSSWRRTPNATASKPRNPACNMKSWKKAMVKSRRPKTACRCTTPAS